MGFRYIRDVGEADTAEENITYLYDNRVELVTWIGVAVVPFVKVSSPNNQGRKKDVWPIARCRKGDAKWEEDGVEGTREREERWKEGGKKEEKKRERRGEGDNQAKVWKEPLPKMAPQFLSDLGSLPIAPLIRLDKRQHGTGLGAQGAQD